MFKLLYIHVFLFLLILASEWGRGEEAVSFESEEAKEVLEGVSIDDIKLEESEESEEEWDSSYSSKGENITKKVTLEEIVEPVNEYHYAAFDTPNPFVQPNLGFLDPINLAVEGEVSEETDAEGNKKIIKHFEIPIVSLLQKYKLSELLVKGIWELSSGKKRAMIMTPKKEGIIVKVGDPVAVGKVMEIEDKVVTVRQYRIRPDGAREFDDVKMYLGEAPQKIEGTLKLEAGKDPMKLDGNGEKMIGGPTTASGGFQTPVSSPYSGIKTMGSSGVDQADGQKNQLNSSPYNLKTVTPTTSKTLNQPPPNGAELAPASSAIMNQQGGYDVYNYSSSTLKSDGGITPPPAEVEKALQSMGVK